MEWKLMHLKLKILISGSLLILIKFFFKVTLIIDGN